MAEETKKFLDEEMENSGHKLMAKYIALSVVILVILILCVLAWFTSKQKADASGINVQSVTGNGLQVAIEQNNGEWTPYKYEQTFETAFNRKNPLPLISGNGLQFFEPSFVKVAENAYDSLDIDNIEEPVSWQDVTPYKNRKYIEYKLRFRNDKPCNVYLTNESKVTPDTSTKDSDGNYEYDPTTYEENMGDFGFSRNFISATSRVAFLNSDTNENGEESYSLQSLWIPNDDIQLYNKAEIDRTDYSYKKVKAAKEEESDKVLDSTVVKTTGSSSEGLLTGGTPSGYYLWMNTTSVDGDTVTITTENNNEEADMIKIIETGGSSNNQLRAQFYRRTNGQYYINIRIPPGSNIKKNTKLPFVVTNPQYSSNRSLQFELFGDNKMIPKNNVAFYGEGNDQIDTPFGKVQMRHSLNSQGGTGNDYNVNYNGYNYTRFQDIVLLSDPPAEGCIIQIAFSKTRGGTTAQGDFEQALAGVVGGSSLGGVTTYKVDVNKEDKYYPVKGDSLVFSAGTNAISATAQGGATTITDPPSAKTTAFWTVDAVSTDNSFTLKNDSGKYLAIDVSGNIVFSDVGTKFYAVNKFKDGEASATSLNVVRLFTLEGNYYINFDGEKFVASNTYDTTSEYNMYVLDITKIEQKGAWNILTPYTETRSISESAFYCRVASTTESDPDADSTEKKEMNQKIDYFLSSNIPKIPTEYVDVTTSTISKTNYPNYIVSVGGEKDEQGYYVSDEITVRIWGEGYDREAQTPLEGGNMKVSLHFYAVENNETN